MGRRQRIRSDAGKGVGREVARAPGHRRDWQIGEDTQVVGEGGDTPGKGEEMAVNVEPAHWLTELVRWCFEPSQP